MGIPEGWSATSIKEISSTPVSYGVVQTGEPVENGVPCVRVVDMSKGRLVPSNMITTSHEISNSYKRTILSPNDIIIALRGIIGRSALIKSDLSGCNLTRGIAKISPKYELFDPMFILQTLNAPTFQNNINRQANGSALQEISIATLRKAVVTTPPLPEQRKIAEILSTWDRAIEVSEALLATAQSQKRALMQALLTGKRRFPEFVGQDWITAEFSEIFITANDKKTQVSKRDYQPHGNTPVVDQGKNFIVGYTNHETVYEEIPVIIFGDHTRELKWVDFAFCPGADGTQLLKTKQGMSLKLGYYLLQNLELPSLGYSRHMRELKQAVFEFPASLKEQEKITATLDDAESEIQLLSQNTEILRTEKRALMQQLLTGKRRVVV